MRGEDRARGIVLRGEETSTIDTVKHPLWLDVVSEGRKGEREGGREGVWEGESEEGGSEEGRERRGGSEGGREGGRKGQRWRSGE